MTSLELERPRTQQDNGHYDAKVVDAQAVKALELKVLGWSDIAIGKELGLNRMTVAKRLRYAVETHGQQTVAEYRELGKQRYEALIRTALASADPDNPLEAVRVAGDLNAKLMRLVGAEAPPQVDVHVTVETEQEKSLRRT